MPALSRVERSARMVALPLTPGSSTYLALLSLSQAIQPHPEQTLPVSEPVLFLVRDKPETLFPYVAQLPDTPQQHHSPAYGLSLCHKADLLRAYASSSKSRRGTCHGHRASWR